MTTKAKSKLHRLLLRQGQSTLEYAMIVVVVVAALMAMSVYVQRSVQANLRSIENQINAQPTEASVGSTTSSTTGSTTGTGGATTGTTEPEVSVDEYTVGDTGGGG